MSNNFTKISYFFSAKIARESILKCLIYSAEKYAKGDLVDLGCGTRPYQAIFHPYIKSYFGIDHPDTAKVNYGNETKADLYVDVIDTGLDAEQYDTLISTQVMEHVYDTKKFLSESHRLLKHGGIGIYTVPFVWQLHAEPYDFYRFTKYSLKLLFEEAGFEIIELKPTSGVIATLAQTIIVSGLGFHYLKSDILSKLLQKAFSLTAVPLLNFLALRLDRIFYSDKLCLDYLIIVRKK